MTFLITVFLIGSASAQSASDRAVIDKTIGFGPRIGYYKAQDADEGNFYFGLQKRFRFYAILGIEVSVE